MSVKCILHGQQDDTKFDKAGGTISGPIDMQNNQITNIKNPVNDSDAATKKYVDDHTVTAMIYEELPAKPSTPIADGQEIPYTWKEINAITLAGKAQEYFSLGATKLVNLSTAVLGANTATMRIIGFNQDGENTTTFQTKNALPTTTVFGSSAVWIGSTARTQCQNFYNACDAKSFIKTVSKGTCPSANSSRNGDVTYNDETVFLLSEREFGLDSDSPLSTANSSTSKAECTANKNFAYSYYTSNSTRIMYLGDTSTSSYGYPWERSRNYTDSTNVCCVYVNGSATSYRYNNNSRGLAPAFVIGNSDAPSPSAKITQDGEDITDKVKELMGGGTLYTATIGTTWSEDSTTGTKYQEVAISGIKSTDGAQIDHVFTGSDTSNDYAAFVEAENQYLTYITNGYAETIDGAIKFVIFGDAPTVEIPIVVKVG